MIATENTWSNQRRKRRANKLLQSVCPNSASQQASGDQQQADDQKQSGDSTACVNKTEIEGKPVASGSKMSTDMECLIENIGPDSKGSKRKLEPSCDIGDSIDNDNPPIKRKRIADDSCKAEAQELKVADDIGGKTTQMDCTESGKLKVPDDLGNKAAEDRLNEDSQQNISGEKISLGTAEITGKSSENFDRCDAKCNENSSEISPDNSENTNKKPSAFQDFIHTLEENAHSDIYNEEGDFILKFKLNVKKGEKFLIEMSWVDGRNRELMHQVLQYVKNQVKSNNNELVEIKK